MSANPFRELPSVSRLLGLPELEAALAEHPHAALAEAAREELDDLRARLAAKESIALEGIAGRVLARLTRNNGPALRGVINATGIVLHTNLGRSPLAETAAQAAYDAARSYSNLELDLGTGRRGSRQDAVRAGIRAITGAEAATAVNNCAAATVLALRTLAAGKEAIVSRGQLVLGHILRHRTPHPPMILHRADLADEALVHAEPVRPFQRPPVGEFRRGE